MTISTRGRRSRNRRREEANLRQANAAKRTPSQQLERLDAGGHTAKRERTRLLQLILDALAPKAKTKSASDPTRTQASKVDRKARKAARKAKRWQRQQESDDPLEMEE